MSKNFLSRVWDFGIKHAEKGHTDDIVNQNKFCRMTFEAVTGEIPDISEYVDFDFYDLV